MQVGGVYWRLADGWRLVVDSWRLAIGDWRLTVDGYVMKTESGGK